MVGSDQHEVRSWGRGQGYHCTRCEATWDRDEEPPEICNPVESHPDSSSLSAAEELEIERLADEHAAAASSEVDSSIAIGHHLVSLFSRMNISEFSGNCTLKPLPGTDFPRQIEYHWQGAGGDPGMQKSGLLEITLGGTTTTIAEPQKADFANDKGQWWYDPTADRRPNEKTGYVLTFCITDEYGMRHVEFFYDRVTGALRHEDYLLTRNSHVAPKMIKYASYLRMQGTVV